MAEVASAATAASAAGDREVSLVSLSLEQLNSIKSQIEGELQELQKQLESLSLARSRFSNAKTILLDLSTSKVGEKLLVPLNSSLYVPGTIADPDKVIVELGTGYFAEKSVSTASELIDRKSHLVGKSIESVEGVVAQKRKSLENVVQVMQYKISLLQQKK